MYVVTASFGSPPAPTPDRPHPRPTILPGTFTDAGAGALAVTARRSPTRDRRHRVQDILQSQGAQNQPSTPIFAPHGGDPVCHQPIRRRLGRRRRGIQPPPCGQPSGLRQERGLFDRRVWASSRPSRLRPRLAGWSGAGADAHEGAGAPRRHEPHAGALRSFVSTARATSVSSSERWSPKETSGPGAMVRAAQRLKSMRPDVVHRHDAKSHATGVPAARMAGSRRWWCPAAWPSLSPRIRSAHSSTVCRSIAICA